MAELYQQPVTAKANGETFTSAEKNGKQNLVDETALNKEWLMSEPWFQEIALEYKRRYGRIWADEQGGNNEQGRQDRIT